MNVSARMQNARACFLFELVSLIIISKIFIPVSYFVMFPVSVRRYLSSLLEYDNAN